jgi:hypothetical protein
VDTAQEVMGTLGRLQVDRSIEPGAGGAAGLVQLDLAVTLGFRLVRPG